MNLFKKSAAVVALLTLVSGLFSTGVNAYSPAQLDAANFLAGAGIIVDHAGNPAGYNLDQNVLRQEIAAVARGIAGLDKATVFQGFFKDVTQTTPNDWAWASVEPLRANGLIAANEYFNPERNISKAEAIGMVVKAAFGNEYAYDSSLSTSWQQQVVAFAVSKGVIASFSDFDTAATRGFVFEAGANAKQAVDGSSNNNDLCDILSALGIPCDNGNNNNNNNTGTGTTPPVVGVGELGVSLNPSSPAGGGQIPSTGSVLFGKVDFTAGNSDVAINTVEVRSLGLATVPVSTRIWFEKDGRRFSGRAAFTSDRTAIVSFAPAYVVRAGTTDTLDLYVELSTSAGNDFQFTGTATNTSAARVSGSFTTAALRTAEYTVAPVQFQSAGAATTYNQSDDYIELGSFRLMNLNSAPETRDILFQSVTLRNLGTGDLPDLTDLYIERDGERVSTSTDVSGKDATFVLNNIVRDGVNGLYYIKAKVANVQGVNGDTYQFQLRNTSDLSAVEVLNGFRSTVWSDFTAGLSNPVSLQVYTVNGANIQFARNTTVDLSRTAAPGSQDVTLLQGTITSKSPITLENLVLPYLITNSGTGTSSPSNLFNVIFLKIGSSTFTWSPTSADGVNGTGTFLGLAQINGTADIRIYANLRDSIDPTQSPNFRFMDLRGDSFGTLEYVNSQNLVGTGDFVGSIAGVSLTIGATGLNVARVDGLGLTGENIVPGSSDVLVNGVNLTINQGNNVRVSGVSYDVTGTSALVNNAFATLYVNGVAVNTQTIRNTGAQALRFTGFSQLVTSANPVRLDVRVSFTESFADGDQVQIQLSGMNAIDTVSSQAVNPGAYPSAATLTFRYAQGTVLASDNNPRTSLFLGGSTSNEIFAFRVQARNDNIRLNDLTFSGAGLDNFSNFRLRTPSGAFVSASTASSGAVTFRDMNLSETVNADNTATFFIVADANTNTNATGIVIGFDDSVTALNQFRGTNGQLYGLTGVTANISGNPHAVSDNRAVVAKASNPSKEITSSALRFTVTASGRDAVVLSGASLDVSLSGYDVGSGVVNIYRGSVASANLVASGTLGATGTGAFNLTPAVTFTGLNNTVDSGNTNTFIVTVEGIIVDSAANNQGWTVRLNDLTIQPGSTGTGTYNISTYQNLGDLPITEVR